MRNLLTFASISLLILVGSADTALAQCTTPICAAPTALSFTSSTPSLQIALTTSNGGPVSFGVSINSSADWLQVDQLLGLAPTTLTASVKANVPAGVYSATITITPSTGPAVQVSATGNLTGIVGASALSATPNPLVFSAVPVGTTPSPFTFSLTNTGAATTVQISSSPTSGSPWFTVSPTATNVIPGTAVPVTVTVNTGLTAGIYTGNVIITPQTGAQLTVGVSLNVGASGTGSFTVSPNPLPAFTFTVGSSVPSTQTLTVTATNAVVTVSAANTTTGATWLSVNPAGNQTVTPGTPFSYMVSANPLGLQPGNYTGNITVTQQGGGGGSVVVPVSMAITGASTLTFSPANLFFAYQTGTSPLPPPQTLTVGSTGGAIQFVPSATTLTGGSWLVVNQNNTVQTTPAPLTVQVNPSGLPPGTYSGTITLTAFGAASSTATINVQLLVSTQPILTFENSATTFTYQFSGSGPQTLPPAQTVQITSGGTPLPITVSTTPVTGGNFLNVAPTTGTTPQRLSFTLNPSVVAGLAPGTYTETVTVTSPTAGNSPQNYTVTLVVTNSTLLNPSQSALSFNYQIGQAQPLIQTIGVTSTGAPLAFSVSTTANATPAACANFLSAAPPSGSTANSQIIAVSVSTAGVPAGATCTGTVSISSPGAGNSPVSIPVTLFVSAAPLLNVSPSAVNVSATVGANPANQTVSLTSTDAATVLPYTVTSTTDNGGSWLLVGPTSGSTPSNLNIGFNTAGLTVGTYTGSIRVAATGPANTPVVIPVSVVVAPTATASATPASLTFMQPFGGPPPATQAIVINSTTTGLTFAATATTFNGGSWLSVSPPSGATSQSVTVSANGTGLAQGAYSGVVTFQIPGAANSPVSVSVSLIVGPSQSLVLSANSATFNFQAGSGTPPNAQSIQLTSLGGNVPFTATAATVGGLNLLTVTPASGTTPAALSIGLNQTALATLTPGNYTGAITVASPGLGSQTITVGLTVTASAPPNLMAVVSGASLQPGSISPGEIVTLFGTGLGPTTGVGLALTPQGTVSTSLGNTTVTFDGIAAPLIFVRADQVNAIVPYEIAGRISTTVVVQRGGQSSAGLQVRVADTAPAIFSLTQGGNGQGAILNSNNTVNGPANPAPKGSTIVIYATGEGSPVPPGHTGSVTGITPPFPMIPNVSVMIAGQPAVIQYAGEAPGLVAGVLQVNAVVPLIIGSGPQTVVLSVAGATNNQQTITVMVQ